MTDLIREYLNSKDLRLHGSNVSVMPGENGNVLSPGTFPGDIFGGSYPQMDPNETPQEMGQRMSDAQQNTGLGNVLVGGAKRAIQGAVDYGTELLELGGEQFLAQAGLTRGGEPINLSIPKPVLFKDIPKPEGALEGIAQDFAQFGFGMAISPGTNVIKGALSGTYFDPENGAFISGLRELGIGKDALAFLDFKVDEDATTEERVISRMFQGLEELGLTAFGEGIIKALKEIKNSPALLEKARETIVQAGQKIGTDAQARLDANKGSTSLSAMGVAEVESAIDTQLAKLAPTTFKMSPEGTRGHKVPHQLLVEGSGEKPTTLVTQTFIPTNKQTNLDNIDALKNNHPDALLSAENWLKMEQEGLGGDHLPIPPMVAINYANDPNKMVEKLKSLTPEMKAGVDEGFSYVKNIREVYQSGEATPKMTADLFVWGILSRGAGPVQQESAFIDIIDGSKDLIQKAVDGNFTEADQILWENTIKNLMPKGSPGKQVTMNVNATGKLLFELSKKVDGSDDTVLQTLHNMIGNPNRSAKDIRREFMALTEGAGIDNKVVSFTLLVSGRDDVLVMDRIQGRHLWDDGRFEGFNLYDGYKKEGTTAKEGLQGIFRGPRGLLITEMLEDGLRKNINEVYNILGRLEDASLGRWHWENWVIEGEQVVSHSTLEAITKGSAVGTNVVEGKPGTFSSGTKYIKGKEGAVIEYPLSDGSVVYLTPERQKEFEAFIKKEKNGIVPKGFKVSENTGVPWYERPEVNREKLDRTAREFANSNIHGEVLSSSKGAGESKNTSGSSNRTSRGKITTSSGGG